MHENARYNMSRPKQTFIEYRNYELPTYFPIVMLTGDIWRISDVRSERLHFHNCLEIGICESDSGSIEFLNTPFYFKEGAVTLVGSDIAHTTYSSPGTASRWSYIFVDIEALLAPYLPLSLFMDQDILSTMQHSYCAIISRDRNPEIGQLIHQIIDMMKKKEDHFQYAVRGLMLTLLVLLQNIYKKTETIDPVSALESKDNSLVISPALSYIRNNYMQDFQIDDLAQLCNMSPTHFRRTFTSIMGTAPLDYLNRERIAKASVLLRSTEMPVLAISEEVGFRSISSFNRHFAEIMDTSPLKWRNQMSYIRDQSVLKYTGWLVPPKDI